MSLWTLCRVWNIAALLCLRHRYRETGREDEEEEKVTAKRIFADLISNYDLVMHSIVSLYLQRVNVPKEPTHFTFTNFQNMVHLFRTDFGESTNTYGGEIWEIPLKTPPQGLGQGNRASPEIWAVVISTLLNCFREAGHGAPFKFSILRYSFNLEGYYFVDDSTIVQVVSTPDTPQEERVKRAQKGLNIFQECPRQQEDKLVQKLKHGI